jgi:hypothetical protein
MVGMNYFFYLLFILLFEYLYSISTIALIGHLRQNERI